MDLAEIVKLWEVVQVFHRYTPFQRVALVVGTPIALYVVYLCTIGRPPLTLPQLQFVLLQDGQVRPLRSGGDSFEVEFRLLNATKPPAEVHNVFGQIWVQGADVVASTLPPARGQAGSRVEWDIQAAVLPKEGVFVPTKMVLRMPLPSNEITIGAQFVSTETDKDEYLWRIINEGGIPKTVVVRSPRAFK